MQHQHLPVFETISSKGRLLSFSSPIVMGILNTTPNSFYTRHDNDLDGLLKNAEVMLKQGATILDVGGASTKPGEKLANPAEEERRVVPAIQAIAQRFPDTWVSVDTYNATVAAAAVAAGAHIVNDISGGKFDANMLATVANLKVPYIAMHIQGTPETMQQHPMYTDVVMEVYDSLRLLCDSASAAGITDIILDPGFGFGKTVAHNFALLKQMHQLRSIGKPILAGISRKSMICKPLGINPENALNGTTALHAFALQQGASILRVHDVKEAMEVVKLYKLWVEA
jgi:dihydropteroate synthase